MSFYGNEGASAFIRKLYKDFSKCWCAETCAPRMRAEWSEANPTFGQCSITSFIVQDIMGGEVYGIPLEGGGYHCFNVAGGYRFDLTSEQFGEEALDYDNCVLQSREEHFKDADKYMRYLLLKEKLKAVRGAEAGARVIHTRIDELEAYEESSDGGEYQYTELPVTPADSSKHCQVCFYRVPPKKANYPYHYHLDQEEVFYIISGHGLVKTPEDEKPVAAGDILFFPAGEAGAHKLKNTSETEELVYIDFDTVAAMDVAVYPDSEKVGIWSPDLNKVFRLKDRAHYYDGEE